ncbi:RNA deprotection pyrophosphohydrolase [Alkalihalobacillus deserti]|uniref:RNA deprotection pyrophosphohydrolase n=1 Tax=Alkalihalobacillus deserti TaxID=2879466 RepID=UPI001D14D472|nr:nucleoside triphosphatase YtkD [Alkalihalobacillus deserti]
MYVFKDFHNCEVRLTFEKKEGLLETKHVWVVCRYLDKWLLTNHSTRGWEFPGGKVEEGESITEAAEREVWEETGATIKSLHFIGQYEVKCDRSPFFQKAIFFAEINSLLQKATYFETDGPILLDELPANIKENPSFSFMMKDEVLPHTLKQIAKQQLL